MVRECEFQVRNVTYWSDHVEKFSPLGHAFGKCRNVPRSIALNQLNLAGVSLIYGYCDESCLALWRQRYSGGVASTPGVASSNGAAAQPPRGRSEEHTSELQ